MRVRHTLGALVGGIAAAAGGCGRETTPARADSVRLAVAPDAPPAVLAPRRPGLRLNEADSIVLERTGCYGECPIYRLRVTRGGAVAFASRNVGDTSRTASAAIPREDAQALLDLAQEVGFGHLPDSIRSEPAYCGSFATDNPTATTTVFVGGASKRVVDYLGCAWAPAGLRDLERAIDRATRSSRWMRRNRRWREKFPY